ncbi:MAG: response regulator [Candidatus Aureabacteria bacterium]|nr:response regulator [Candidatus Auribacterota bacterium]
MKEEEKTKGIILVIDDHPFFATNMKYKLAKHGYKVFAAENGIQGIIRAKHVHPDIILIDYIMPAMDGIETCKKIRSEEDLKDCDLIIYTSEAYSNIVSQAVQAGAKDFITKTAPFEKIVEKLDNLMAKRKK